MPQVWHTNLLAVLPSSPLQHLSSSMRLNEEHRCATIFSSLQRCLIRFKDICRVAPWLSWLCALGRFPLWNLCPPQSEVPNHSGAGFHSGRLYTLLLHLSLIPDSSSSSYHGKLLPKNCFPSPTNKTKRRVHSDYR